MTRSMSNYHDVLDEKKRQRAIKILEQISLGEIRNKSLETLYRWKAQGTWCSAYSEWEHLMRRGSDEEIVTAMTSEDENSNRLGQSPPYAAFHYLFKKRLKIDDLESDGRWPLDRQ